MAEIIIALMVLVAVTVKLIILVDAVGLDIIAIMMNAIGNAIAGSTEASWDI